MEHNITISHKRSLKLAIFIYFSTIGIILPYLPLYFNYRGMTGTQIGILLAIGPLMSTLVQFFWGVLSDRLQTVKKVVLFLLIIAGLASMLVFSSNSFNTLVGSVLIFFAFAWPVIPLLDSLTLATTKQTGESYGSYRLWGSLGFAIAALSGGIILDAVGIQNIRYLYQGLIIACILVCLLLIDASPSGRPVTALEIKKLLGKKEVFIFLIMVTFLSVTNKANDAFMGLYIQQLGGGEKEVGLAWTIAPLSEIPVFAFSGFPLARFHELYLLAAASAIFALRWLLFILVSSPGLLIPVQLLHSLTFGLFFMAAVSYIGRLAPAHLRSSGQGLLATCTGGIAGMAGSYFGGLIFSAMGPQYLYKIMAIVAAFTFIAFTLRYRQVVKNKYSSDIESAE